jgi:hypothetical protein
MHMNPVRGFLFVDHSTIKQKTEPQRDYTISKPRRGFLFVDQSLLRPFMNPVRGSLFIDNPYGVVGVGQSELLQIGNPYGIVQNKNPSGVPCL